MREMILLHLARVALWSPLVLFYLVCALRARMRGDTAWHRHYLLLSQLWLAVAIIIGSFK